MCCDANMFTKLQSLKQPQKVTLGDGHELDATRQETITLKTRLPNNKIRKCELQDVILVLKLSFNLLSVSKAAEAGKITDLTKHIVRYWVQIGSSLL